MQTNHKDIQILRELAKKYRDIAVKPIQETRRKLWNTHFSLKKTRPPVLITYGMHNTWCKEVFGDHTLACEDPFYREHERWFRMQIFHDEIGDDVISEPWIPQRAVYKTGTGIYGEPWGIGVKRKYSDVEGGAWKREAPIKSWEDVNMLIPPRHHIDEEATAQKVQALGDAIGDIIEINVERGPVLSGFAGDISTTIAALRGIEQLMLDMYDAPQQLHELLAILRDGILENQREAEEAGDMSLTSQFNQAMPYAEKLERPRASANSGSRKRRELWGFCAAQEYTPMSPKFHDEFLFQYQIPIMEHYGLVHYGCCEDLTRKIDMLRQLKNLRSIAVTPAAKLRKCAEQIGRDYVISWRPNPTEMVCTSWDEDRIRRILREGLDMCKENFIQIRLKDVETVQGEPERLARWTRIVREVSEEL